MTRVWQRFLGAFVALLPAVAIAAPITTQGTWYGTNGWDGTLRGRDASGNPVNLLDASATAPNPSLKYVYDTVLDLTWLANWNAGARTSFDNWLSTSDGTMTWANAKAWAASLTDFGGGWALPSVLDTGTPGCNVANSGTDCYYNVYGSDAGRAAGSPLAHMYYDTLGNKSVYDASGGFQPDYGLKNTGPFSNMQSRSYWSGTAFVDPEKEGNEAWVFSMSGGSQNGGNQDVGDFAVAVRPGDVFAASVPEPEGLALLGLAFGAFAVVRLRRRAH